MSSLQRLCHFLAYVGLATCVFESSFNHDKELDEEGSLMDEPRIIKLEGKGLELAQEIYTAQRAFRIQADAINRQYKEEMECLSAAAKTNHVRTWGELIKEAGIEGDPFTLDLSYCDKYDLAFLIEDLTPEQSTLEAMLEQRNPGVVSH